MVLHNKISEKPHNNKS